MSYLDDLPQRNSTHVTAAAAETAFDDAIAAHKYFVIQTKDRQDYGTDYQLEVCDRGSMTNLRVHVQLKGTEKPASSTGIVQVEVERQNLNYLLNQPHSLYVCYHLPTQRLLVRETRDVHREYEHRDPGWRRQKTITIKFNRIFDEGYRQSLSALVIASGRSARDRRLKWTASPPRELSTVVRKGTPQLELPNDTSRVRELLSELYEAGEDLLISNSFEQFHAVLGAEPGAMNSAYMAEINLGVNNLPFDRDRVHKGISVLQEAMDQGDIHQGSLLYSQANGWLALKEYERARDTYRLALAGLDEPKWRKLAAQCCKNMGSALSELEKPEAARTLYERALELDPDLSEAHFALALWHRQHGDDLAKALEHFDQVAPRRGSPLKLSNVQGWRMELLFRNGNIEAAFREVQALLEHAEHEEWIWSWCARQVATFGRFSASSSEKSLHFWRAYLEEHPDDIHAEMERLLCLFHVRSENVRIGVDFHTFKAAMIRLIQYEELDTAFLWDRIGHWAQYDADWVEAEAAYRKAYELQPDRYSYCLGTALNFLGRYTEALPFLIQEVEGGQADAMTWFQIAVARSGAEDLTGAITAYHQAIELDEGYELAWFNLGGAYWNAGDVEAARATWREAIKRFPEHSEVQRLRDFEPLLFPVGEIER